MNRVRWIGVVLWIVWLGAADVARADGWSWGDWKWFGAERSTAAGTPGKSKPAGTRPGTDKPFFASSTPKKKSSSGPSWTARIASGTRDAWEGAVDIVTLKPLRTAVAPKPPKSSGPPWAQVNSGQTSSRAKPKASESSSWFGGWFRGAEEPSRPRTANDFLSQPRLPR